MHIRFNGAGGHYPYLLGIANVLQKNYNLENVIFSGYSAGCIPALLLCLGLDIQNEIYNINIPLLTELKKYKTKTYFNFLPCLEQILINRFNSISNDLYIKANNRMHCNLTHIPSLKNHIYCNYTSNEDLVKCNMASGHIPFYNNKLLYTYRNNYYIDGGLAKKFDGDCLFKNDNMFCLEIKTSMFRTLETSFVFISSELEYSNYLYNLGIKDATDNLFYFDLYLKK